MKRIIVGVMAVIVWLTVLVSCGNYDMFDTNNTYTRAIITYGDGQTFDINIKQWRDYGDGEQLQIVADDGTIYLTSSFNTILINEK